MYYKNNFMGVRIEKKQMAKAFKPDKQEIIIYKRY